MRTITYTLNGESAHTPEHFYATVSGYLGLEEESVQSAEAFTHALAAFIKTQEQPITIIWKHHRKAQEYLGFGATCQYYEQQLQLCQSSQVLPLRKELERLKRKQKGLFEIVLETLQQSSNTITVILE